MSKERLEGIKKHAEHKVLRNHKNEIRHEMTEIKTVDYEWLIEQAERLHGKNHLMGLAGMYEDCNRMVADLTSQNKRYREAIERALGESGWGDEGNALYRTIGILTKALEGEE